MDGLCIAADVTLMWLRRNSSNPCHQSGCQTGTAQAPIQARKDSANEKKSLRASFPNDQEVVCAEPAICING
jgi:hypothetical protein